MRNETYSVAFLILATPFGAIITARAGERCKVADPTETFLTVRSKPPVERLSEN